MKKIPAGAMLERFPNWLSDPRNKKPLCYWIGFLAKDRVKYVPIENPAYAHQMIAITNVEVDALANMVYGAYKRGQVLLAQAKVENNLYYYFAFKRSKR